MPGLRPTHERRKPAWVRAATTVAYFEYLVARLLAPPVVWLDRLITASMLRGVSRGLEDHEPSS